jgi:hypothetical protein
MQWTDGMCELEINASVMAISDTKMNTADIKVGCINCVHVYTS